VQQQYPLIREQLPELDRPEDIWALLSDGCITLTDEPGCFSINWNCTWNDGVHKTFVNWKLAE
jgi:hypothetical protein